MAEQNCNIQETLEKSLRTLIECAYLIAEEKGWHDSDNNDGECIALMHSELSEALEALRRDNPADTNCPAFTSLEIELADVIIRIFDYAGLRRLNLAEAILAKMKYNHSRGYKHGDKAF